MSSFPGLTFITVIFIFFLLVGMEIKSIFLDIYLNFGFAGIWVSYFPSFYPLDIYFNNSLKFTLLLLLMGILPILSLISLFSSNFFIF